MAETHRRLTGRLASVLAELRGVEPAAARLCHAGSRMLDADGAALMLMTSPESMLVVATTDVLATRLEDLQDTLGEGPTRRAFHDEVPQAADFGAGVDAVRDVRWPLLLEHVRELPFDGSVLSVPLRPSGTVIGCLTVHRQDRFERVAETTADFLSVAIGTALLHDSAAGRPDDLYREVWTARAEIHQATGMVISQVRVRPEDALALLRAQAFASGTSLVDVARSVVRRHLDFKEFDTEDPDTDTSEDE